MKKNHIGFHLTDEERDRLWAAIMGEQQRDRRRVTQSEFLHRAMIAEIERMEKELGLNSNV